MKDYFSQRNAKNNAKLLEIIDKHLPAFCDDFFIGVENRTTPLTRLNYAYDFKLFFSYLTENVSRFKGKSPKELTLTDMESLNGSEIERYLRFLSFYESSGKKDDDGQGGISPAKTGQNIQRKNTEQGKQRKLSSISSLIRYFERKEKLTKNPVASVEKPKLRGKEIVRLEASEIPAMFDVVERGVGSNRQQKYQENTRIRDLAIVALMLGTGIRVSELVGINCDDVNFDDLSFVVTRKGGARVILYFSDEVAGYLYDYFDVRKRNKKVDQKEKALFLSLQNSRICTRSVENVVKKYSQIAAPLKHITPHKLRTTFGTQLYRNTGDIFVVADVLGHTDVNTTKKHYAAISDDVRRKASTRVNLRESDTQATYLDETGERIKPND